MRAMSAVLLSEEATERWNMSTSKTKKKLILNKQGIRQLTASDLAAAKGGESEGPCTYGFCQSDGCGGKFLPPGSPRGGSPPRQRATARPGLVFCSGGGTRPPLTRRRRPPTN